MAKIIRVTSRNPRRKKWEHFKLRCRIWLFRTSYSLNAIAALFLLHDKGKLTYLYEKIAPWLESLIKQLPH